MEFLAGFFALFALGTFWFWAACAVVFFSIMFFEENENNIGAAVVLGIFVVVMENSGAFNLFADPWWLVKWTALYFVVGAAWSFIKWFSFLNKRAERFAELKAKYLERDNMTLSDCEGASASKPSDEFKNYLDSAGYLGYYSDSEKTIIPLAKNNVNRLSTWILWWPTSALWTLLNDPLVRLAKYIVRRLNVWYDAIANRVFAKFDA